MKTAGKKTKARQHRSGALRPDDRVCYCRAVDAGDIRAVMVAGCRDFDTLLDRTEAGSGCGSCIGDVRRLHRRLLTELRAEREGQLLLPIDD